MRAIGIVNWTTNDKAGNPIAGVVPLYEIDGENWRPINAAKEFPTQGQLFWPSAREATELAIIFFDVEDNGRHKDKYRVSDPCPAVEVVDLRKIGGPGAVRSALTLGIRRRDVREGLVLVRCAPDLLVGPIKLVRKPSGSLTFEATNPDRIPSFAGVVIRSLRTLRVASFECTILPMPLEAMSLGAPTGYVDWCDDKLIVRRALKAAVNRAKRTGADPGLTKRWIDEAAESVAGEGGGAELELERYRLERARELCSEAANISRLAGEFAEELVQHPSVVQSLDPLRAHVKADLEKQLRAEVESSLMALRDESAALERQISQKRSELLQTGAHLETARQELGKAQMLATAQISELDAEISRRISDSMDRPVKVLADVAILRGFLGGGHPSGAASPRIETSVTGQLTWARAGSTVDESGTLRRMLFDAFRSLGIAPAQALRLHASVIAGVMPVMSGSGGLAALIAYAQIVCGGRVAILHVPSDLLYPLSLDCDEVRGAVLAARPIPAPSLVVFEGANRSPTEAYLSPFLQVLDIMPAGGERTGIASIAAGGESCPPGLRWAATVVSGAATVPLSRDIWAHATCVHVDRARRGGLSVKALTELDLSSEIMLPGDTPEEVIEEILVAWPLANEIEACLRSFASALARFESDPHMIKTMLVECALLPLVASLRDGQQRADALERLQELAGNPSDGAASLADLEQRLRSRLA